MGEEAQSIFTVSDVASIFSVNEETVRRWIRSGKLKASISNCKDGHRIAESDLREFVFSEKPKYRKLLPFMGVSLLSLGAVSPILGAVVGSSLGSSLSELIKQSIQERIVDILRGSSVDKRKISTVEIGDSIEQK